MEAISLARAPALAGIDGARPRPFNVNPMRSSIALLRELRGLALIRRAAPSK